MVHHKAYALAVGVFVESGQVKVGVGGYKVEHVVFLAAEPIFPAFVPALYEQGVEAVCRGKVDVGAHVLVVGSVPAVGLEGFVVGHTELYRGYIVGVAPLAASRYHLPPYSHILDRMNPAHIFQCARLVEVEYEPGGQYFACVVNHHYRAPGACAGRLEACTYPFGVGSKVDVEHHCLVVKVEVGGGVVDHGGLVQVDVQPLVGFHLQGGLHSRGRESCC